MLGRNGAGKTTALMAIAGVVTNRAQALRLAGEDISHMPSFKRVRKGLSLVPSGSRAFPNLTVNENLELVRGGSERRRPVDDGRRLPHLPEARRAEGEQRRHALGRRAPDARGGARDAGRPEAAHARRAERGARADGRQGDRRAAPGRCAARASASCSPSRTTASRSTSPTASTSSRRDRSSGRATRPRRPIPP